jgi:hypothetical protein
MTRIEKIRQLEKFFSGRTVKAKSIVVFKTLINGEYQAPFKNAKEFEKHVQELKTKYEEVIVWEEDKTY